MAILYYTEGQVGIQQVNLMTSKLTLVGWLIVVGLAGCATSTRSAIENVRPDMSTDEVLALVGEPVAQADLEPFQAWRYEYGVQICSGGSGELSPPTCRRQCQHTTVWFNDNEVRSMTSILVDSMEECGTDSTPINWEHMPDYVKAPDA